MDNLATWNRLKAPPQSALKKIEAGRLRGKSDINPQWRIQALTEEFGPYGIGWYVEVVRKWSEPGSEGQVFAFADVNLSVKYPDSEEWSMPAPGTGGNMLVEMESKGLHASDEGYKMAITDAISTAAKLFGLAADVYLGNFDGSKYTRPAEQGEKQPETLTLVQPPATDEDRKGFEDAMSKLGYTIPHTRNKAKKLSGHDDYAAITRHELAAVYKSAKAEVEGEGGGDTA